MNIENSIDLLRGIRRKRAMYFGNSDHPFTSLVAFICGFDLARGIAGYAPSDARWELVPNGEFNSFVAARLKKRTPTAAGWMTHIRESTKTEEEAFELFFQLREDFEVHRHDRKNA
jgi:hypothetical protein